MENLVGDRPNPLAADLDHVFRHTKDLWKDLRGQRIFVTGGTGFFGCWLIESFLWANDALTLGASVVVLTRQGSAFRKKAPHLANHRAVTLHDGDVRTFGFPEGSFSHVIHAATASASALTSDNLLLMFDTIVTGTHRTLEFARRSGARRFLLTSSGAVYGRQPADIAHLSEEYLGGPDPVNARSVYAEGKRAAETLCAAYGQQYGLEPTIARCFAFVGPYLPLDAHFAVGNFIRDGLSGGPICISGDGTAHRSYLYAADLAIWLWTILLQGHSRRPYNVGSEAAISIADLAHAVARQFAPETEIRIARTPVAGEEVERYIPSTTRARNDLGVAMTVDLEEALTRTVEWHRGRTQSTHVAS